MGENEIYPREKWKKYLNLIVIPILHHFEYFCYKNYVRKVHKNVLVVDKRNTMPQNTFFAQTFPTTVFSADRKFIGLERTSGNILQELSVTKEKWRKHFSNNVRYVDKNT